MVFYHGVVQSKTSLKPLKVILNRLIRCVRFIYHKKVTLSLLYKKVDILQLSDIYNLELGKLMFKYSQQMLPSNFSLFFNLNK